MIPLTDKELLFCERYLISSCATRAARESEYSPSYGGTLLAKDNIKEFIDDAIACRSVRLRIDADYVLNGIRDVTEKAVAECDYSNALKGYHLLGKNLKLFTDVQEHKFDVKQMGRVMMKDDNGNAIALDFNVGKTPNLLDGGTK